MKTPVIAEQTLTNSELRYRRLFEAAQDGILLLDAKTGMIEDVNPFLIKMLGYSRSEFVKKKLWEIGAVKDIEASKHAFETLQDNEYIRYEDLPLKTNDGRLIQVEFVSNVYAVGDEKVIQCNIRDVTEHRRIVAALQENEKIYHDLVNQSPDGFFVIEFTGKIIAANQTMCQELGFSRSELLSMNIWDIIPNHYLNQYRERLTNILKGKSLTTPVEYEVLGKDGKQHFVEVLSAPHFKGKDIVGFQGIARDVTARKQMMEALSESERRFSLATWVTRDVVWERNLESKTISWNDNLQKLFQYLVDEIEPTVEWWQDHIHPAVRDKVTNSIQTAIKQGEDFWSEEYRFRLADGSYADIYDRGYILYNEQGKPLKMIGAMADITEQKQVQEALRKSEEKFRSWIENSSDLVSVIELDGTIQYVSPSYEPLLGYKPETLIGTNAFALVHPDDHERLRQIFIQSMQKTDNMASAEFRMRHQDGSWRQFAGKGKTFQDGQGQIIGLINSRDITERQQAEEALRASEAKFRSYVEYAPLGVFVADRFGRYVEVNMAATEMTGYSETELLLLSIPDVLAPQSLEAGQESFQKVVQDGFATAEFLFRHKDGTQFWATVIAVKLNEDRYMSYCQNITERKRAELEIHQRLNELELLYQSGLAFSQVLTPKAIAEKIIELLDLEMKWHHTTIRLYNPKSQELELIAFNLPNPNGGKEHTTDEEQLNLIQSTGQGLCGWVYQHGQVVRSNDLENDPRYFEIFPNLKSGLYIPIKNGGRVTGVISIESEQAQAFSESDERLASTLAGQAAIAIENATLFDDLQGSNSELLQAYETTLEGWSRTLELRDKETEEHTLRVTRMTVTLARTFGLSEAELVDVRRGGLLHDIGKMGVPDHILLKHGPLTDEEWVLMKMHPTFAHELLTPIRYLQNALDIPYCHHEKWDGTGYPRGLKGDQIPLVARIFAVVDVWDALISDRPYRPAWTKEKTREHIQAQSGTAFDPQVVEAFMKLQKKEFESPPSGEDGGGKQS